MNNQPQSAWLLPPLSRRSWWLVGLAVVVMVLLQVAHSVTEPILRYDRNGILASEYWRLVTGHVVHFSYRHLWANFAGLLAIVWLFAGVLSLRQLMCTLALSVAAIDLGLWLFMPQLISYVGLSGVLHGILAAGCVGWWRTVPRGLAAALTAVLFGKLIWEQVVGELPLAGEMEVIVNAHLYGALGGLVCGLGSLAVFLRKHR
jgi:rhomboid family GlyGly-CTERM serine protease